MRKSIQSGGTRFDLALIEPMKLAYNYCRQEVANPDGALQALI
jgi:hypothetical protein